MARVEARATPGRVALAVMRCRGRLGRVIEEDGGSRGDERVIVFAGAAGSGEGADHLAVLHDWDTAHERRHAGVRPVSGVETGYTDEFAGWFTGLDDRMAHGESIGD